MAVGKLRVIPPGHGYGFAQVGKQSQIPIIRFSTGNKSDDCLADAALPHHNHSRKTLEPPLVVYIGRGSDIRESSVTDNNRGTPYEVPLYTRHLTAAFMRGVRSVPNGEPPPADVYP